MVLTGGLRVVSAALRRYGDAMTFTVRLLKLPERAVREEATYPDITAALEADDYSLVVGGAFEVEITNDETGDVVHTRQIANKVPDIL